MRKDVTSCFSSRWNKKFVAPSACSSSACAKSAQPCYTGCAKEYPSSNSSVQGVSMRVCMYTGHARIGHWLRHMCTFQAVFQLGYSMCHSMDTALCNYLKQVRPVVALKSFLKVDSIIIHFVVLLIIQTQQT